jgi:hypothetical protein
MSITSTSVVTRTLPAVASSAAGAPAAFGAAAVGGASAGELAG